MLSTVDDSLVLSMVTELLCDHADVSHLVAAATAVTSTQVWDVVANHIGRGDPFEGDRPPFFVARLSMLMVRHPHTPPDLLGVIAARHLRIATPGVNRFAILTELAAHPNVTAEILDEMIRLTPEQNGVRVWVAVAVSSALSEHAHAHMTASTTSLNVGALLAEHPYAGDTHRVKRLERPPFWVAVRCSPRGTTDVVHCEPPFRALRLTHVHIPLRVPPCAGSNPESSRNRACSCGPGWHTGCGVDGAGVLDMNAPTFPAPDRLLTPPDDATEPWGQHPSPVLCSWVDATLRSFTCSAELAWSTLALCETTAMVLASRGLTGPGREFLERLEDLRTSWCALEPEEVFVRRCAAGLVALDGLPVDFTAAQAASHIPPVTVQPETFIRWRDALTAGCRPVTDDVRATALCSQLAADTRSSVLVVLDTTSVLMAASEDSWADRLAASVLGRYGTFGVPQAPTAAVVLAPQTPSRFVAATLLGRTPSRVVCASDDTVELSGVLAATLTALTEHTWREAVRVEHEAAAESFSAAGVLHAAPELR